MILPPMHQSWAQRLRAGLLSGGAGHRGVGSSRLPNSKNTLAVSADRSCGYQLPESICVPIAKFPETGQATLERGPLKLMFLEGQEQLPGPL